MAGWAVDCRSNGVNVHGALHLVARHPASQAVNCNQTGQMYKKHLPLRYIDGKSYIIFIPEHVSKKWECLRYFIFGKKYRAWKRNIWSAPKGAVPENEFYQIEVSRAYGT